MALSFFKSYASQAVRASKPTIRKTQIRSYATHGDHAASEGAVQKRVVTARVVFPSPLIKDTKKFEELSTKRIADSSVLEKSFSESADKEREIMVDRLTRFRQAILDAHEKAGIEYETDLGPNEFPSGPLTLKGEFGTPDKPMIVPSFENERLVGCQGGAGPRHHEILWHNLKKNKPLCCLECGQVFRLVDHMQWLEWAATEWDVNKQDTIQFFIPEE